MLIYVSGYILALTMNDPGILIIAHLELELTVITVLCYAK